MTRFAPVVVAAGIKGAAFFFGFPEVVAKVTISWVYFIAVPLLREGALSRSLWRQMLALKVLSEY